MKIERMTLLVALLASGACGGERLEGHPPADAVTDSVPVTPAQVVDSVLPADEALARFRADIRDIPAGLRGAAESPQALLAEILDLLATSDTAGFERIALDRAEFAYLYYPSSPLARAPYELPPELAWFRLRQENRIGVLRMLREMGGSRHPDAELVCPENPVMQSENRIWTGCRVRTADGEEVGLFGALLEREGLWKVISFANDY